MKKNSDDQFTSEHIDEQIERSFYSGEPPSASSRLLQDMRRYAWSEQQQDTQLLQRAWQRVIARHPMTMDIPGSKRQSKRIERIHLMEQQETHSSPKRLPAQRFSAIVAVLVTVLVVGSMIALFSLARPSSTTTASPGKASDNGPAQAVAPLDQTTPPGIYTGSARRDATNGKIIWDFDLKIDSRDGVKVKEPTFAITNQSMVQDGLVFVVSQDNLVYAVNATTGALAWSDKQAVSLFKNLQKVDGTLYLLNSDGNLLALNAASGKQLSTSKESFDDFTVADGVLYGSQGSALKAIQLSTNKLLWQAKGVDDQSFSLPHVINGKIYLASSDPTGTTSFVYGFNATTGKALWDAQKISGDVFGLTVANGNLYLGSFGLALYAYNGDTGQQLWRKDIAYHGVGALALAGPLVEGNHMYVLFNSTAPPGSGSKAGAPTSIATLDIATGTTQSTYVAPGQGGQIDAFAVHSGTLYVGQSRLDGAVTQAVVAVNASNQVLWTSPGSSDNVTVSF